MFLMLLSSFVSNTRNCNDVLLSQSLLLLLLLLCLCFPSPESELENLSLLSQKWTMAAFSLSLSFHLLIRLDLYRQTQSKR